ncbi:ClpXP protease specificity-enhancing factor [Azonexus sp.]|uniref:ClpXP protease specificity-enhancing factor n=1 Tax=Azonexus sp. TaxID=1872668 RepID=UPI0035B462B0
MEQLPSTKPYLLRALWEWCCDNGFTPYIAVQVDERTRVPREFVRDGQIVLNIGPGATNKLQIGNELIEFQARFGGTARELSVPVEQVSAIYSRENGAGMAFEIDGEALPLGDEVAAEAAVDEPPPEPPRPEGGRPRLQRIK